MSILVIIWEVVGFLKLKDALMSFLTTITAIIILITLFEIINQRESMYKPDIILKSKGNFYMYYEKNGNVFLPSLWTNSEIDTDRDKHRKPINTVEYKPDLQPWSDRQEEPEKRLFANAELDIDRNKIGIPLFNIGMGTAKKIEIKWDFEKKDIIKLLKQFYQEDLNRQSFDIKPSFKITSGLTMVESVDYIPPSKIESDDILEEIYFPYKFQQYFNIYLTCLFNGILKTGKISTDTSNLFLNISDPILNEIPELLLNITYYDIANKIYHKSFRINFKFNRFDVDPNKDFIQLSQIDNINVTFKVKEILNNSI